MQFKFDSKLRVGNVDISLQNLEADEVAIGEFTGNEDSCAHSLHPIREVEAVLVIHDTKVEGHKIVLDNQLQRADEELIEAQESEVSDEVKEDIVPQIEEDEKESY